MDSGPLTISTAAPLIRSGELTPSDLLEQCLARVDAYEPAVQAWVYLDRERARREAARLTDEVKRGQYRGPLHGIPVGIKDIIDVFDMPTGCGSKLWANSYARRDATCVERLRQAGVVILGKTVTTPYAYLDPPPTRNPWNLDRTPGGSSSGSAAAVACGMVLAALGTQTGGSVTRPASYCGVCSLKPTWGRIRVDGVLPLASSLDHVGIMANGVRDLAVVFEVVAGPAAACIRAVDTRPEKLKLYRLRERFDDITPDLAKIYSDAITKLSPDAPDDWSLPAGFAEVGDAHLAIMATEAATVHTDRFQRRPEEYPAKIRELIELGRATSATQLHSATGLRHQLRRQFLAVLGDSTQFITPATRDTAPTPETTGSPMFNAPWSFLGFPTVSVPCGWSEQRLPGAVQLIARPGNEPRLLAAAASVEQRVKFPRRLPPLPHPQRS